MKWNSPTGSNPHLTQTGNQIHEIQKWKKLKSRINAIGLLKGDDITGAVATEVNYNNNYNCKLIE